MGPQDASDRIWLKQAIQFSVDGQVRTIEIALPVRPGASSEEIERLLRQADAGLDQMTQHLSRKVEELLSQQSKQHPGGAVGAFGQAPAGKEGAAGGPAALSGPRAGRAGQPLEGAERLRSAPADAPAGAGGPVLDRKQFIGEAAVLGLNPRQAMERLGIRSLDGVNLRQALEQLRLQLLRESPALTGGPPTNGDEAHSSPSGGIPRTGGTQADVLPRRQVPEVKHGPLLSQVAPLDSAPHPLAESELMLDEEEQALADEAGQGQDEESDLPEQPRAPIPIRGEQKLISLQERVKAQALLERLRRLRGRLNPPSSDNLKAFRNVVENQLGALKTAALLQTIWSVSQPEKLSPEQVAECIRWGKDDHFEEEVDMLLSLTATEES